MFTTKINMKRDKLPHEVTLRQAVPQILDRVDGGLEVGSGRVHR